MRSAATIGSFLLLSVLVYIAYEHPALHAGARTLEGGVVSLYGIVIVGRLRYSVGVHR